MNERLTEKMQEIEDVNKFVEGQLKAKDEQIKEVEKSVDGVRRKYDIQQAKDLAQIDDLKE